MTETISVRVDHAEKQAVERLAGKTGVSRWVRGLIQAKLRSQGSGYAARHKAWLATQTETVNDEAVTKWFQNNRR